jgi:hypothetical protein
MNPYIILKITLFILLIAIPSVFASSNNKDEKLRIAVMPITYDKTQESSEQLKTMSYGIADALNSNLIQLNRFVVIERLKLDQIFNEQSLSASGAVRNDQTIEIGNLTGAKLLIFCSITNYNLREESYDGYRTNVASAFISIRFVNAESGEAITSFNNNFSGSGRNEPIAISSFIKSTADALTEKVKEMYPLSSKIIKMQDNRVIINNGTRAGVKVGDLFNTISIQNDIIDPFTQMSLGRKTEITGKIEVIQANEKIAVAKILRGKSNIKIGDSLAEVKSRATSLFVVKAMVSLFGASASKNLTPKTILPTTSSTGITPDYSIYKTPTLAQVYWLGIGWDRIIKKTYGVELDMGYLTTNSIVKGLFTDALITSRIDVIDERLQLYIKGGICLAYLQMSFPNAKDFLSQENITPNSVDNKAQLLNVGIASSTEAVFIVNDNIQLFGGIGLRLYEPFEAWEVSYYEGADTEPSESMSVSNAYLPLKNIKFNPVEFKFGIGLQF